MPHFKLGVALILVFWPLNWGLPEAWRPTAYLFFPLWLGYALTVDALVMAASGTSILTRSRRGFLMLFVGSAPAWWLFELINQRTQNWIYPGAESFSDLEYFLLSTVAFSTVMPAVFGTAELFRGLPWMNRFARGPQLRPTRRMRTGMLLTGLAMLLATLLWPKVCYPFVWGAVFFILEPLNISMRRPSVFRWLEQGDWRPVAALALGALTCGFFWEMWNFYSYPKWLYHTPGAQFLHIFEMPLLGYLGYLPFAWELFSLRNLLLPPEAAPRL